DLAVGTADRVVDEVHAVGVGVVLVGLEADVGPRRGQGVSLGGAVVAGGAGGHGGAGDAEILVILEGADRAGRGGQRQREAAVGGQGARGGEPRALGGGSGRTLGG